VPTIKNEYLAFAGFWIRVARWYIFITKITVLVHFGRPWSGTF
jgi:hypothetical protein